MTLTNPLSRFLKSLPSRTTSILLPKHHPTFLSLRLNVRISYSASYNTKIMQRSDTGTMRQVHFTSQVFCPLFILSVAAKVIRSVLRTAMFLPSIMRRIDDFLVVKELNAKFFDHVVKEDLLHVAICTPSAALEYDYERLELLGGYFTSFLSVIFISHVTLLH